MTSSRIEVAPVLDYLGGLQDQICSRLVSQDGEGSFNEDRWVHSNGGGGRSRVMENGGVFEKAGVNLSHVKGDSLPASASAARPSIAGKPFEAMGVSLVIHPKNPFVPTTHMNIRLFVADPESPSPVWWFGGGFDLTPYYGFDEDCIHWHQTASRACNIDGLNYYKEFKRWCDDYFYLKHRDETRGIGGVFFDDFNRQDFDHGFRLIQSVGEGFLDAYCPIVERRRNTPWNQKNREFQCYRRGRYVEFNLVYDRGTIFGLQSGGRTESILMSMPPEVSLRYNWSPKSKTKEHELYEKYLKPRDWI